jgi:hypothetical protein
VQIYKELEPLQVARPAAQAKNAPKSAPIPIAAVGIERLNPYGKLDPYVILDGYGPDQLRAVLERASAYRLREAIEVVQEHEPGLKAPAKGRKEVMVDYLVEVVAGKGH